jgi:hypothetical protein
VILLRRLGRDAARDILAENLALPIEQLAEKMPIHTEQVGYSPVGGTRVTDADLAALRAEVLRVARAHGYPAAPVDLAHAEAELADVLHTTLRITANEASVDDAWSYLTCCWLLDVAVWRFGNTADERRFIGNVNRNTFRRLWWRREILGPAIPLAELGEDELVNVMERPTIAGDRRLAQGVASEFLARVAAEEGLERMQLMREAMKRLMRLTPFVSFWSLSDAEVTTLISNAFTASIEGLRGLPTATYDEPVSVPVSAPAPSPDVTPVASVSLTRQGEHEDERPAHEDLGQAAEAAISVAEKTGRVTNITLREALPMSSDDARAVLMGLVELGILARRGVRRGTHYVIASDTEVNGDAPPTDQTQTEPGDQHDHADNTFTQTPPRSGPVASERPSPSPASPVKALNQAVGRFASATRQLDGLRRVARDAASERRSPVAALADRTVEAVASKPGATSVQIAAEVRISEGVLARVLTRLEREGRLVRRGDGWSAASEVEVDV